MSQWEVEVYLYGDMTIPVVVSVSDAVLDWDVPQTQFIARADGHSSCGETLGLSSRGTCDERG